VSSLSSLHRENDSLGSLAFHGLQSTAQGYDLRDLAVKAKFFTEVQGSSVAEREASPLEVDASGQARSTVTYPSIQEIWPVVYSMSSITAIEVSLSSFSVGGGCRLHFPRHEAQRAFVPPSPPALLFEKRIEVIMIMQYTVRANFLFDLVAASCFGGSTLHSPPIDACFALPPIRVRFGAPQVHMVVEVRSRDGDLVYTGPTLRVSVRQAKNAWEGRIILTASCFMRWRGYNACACILHS